MDIMIRAWGSVTTPTDDYDSEGPNDPDEGPDGAGIRVEEAVVAGEDAPTGSDEAGEDEAGKDEAGKAEAGKAEAGTAGFEDAVGIVDHEYMSPEEPTAEPTAPEANNAGVAEGDGALLEALKSWTIEPVTPAPLVPATKVASPDKCLGFCETPPTTASSPSPSPVTPSNVSLASDDSKRDAANLAVKRHAKLARLQELQLLVRNLAIEGMFTSRRIWNTYIGSC